MSFDSKCQAIARWIVAIIGEPLENPDDLFQSLKSGAILCQLMNELQQDSCPDFDPFPETPEAEHDNVSHYLAACSQLGVSESFDPSDLIDEGDVRKVFTNLVAVAKAAADLGFQDLVLPEDPPPEPEPPKPAVKAVTKVSAPVSPRTAATAAAPSKTPSTVAKAPAATAPAPSKVPVTKVSAVKKEVVAPVVVEEPVELTEEEIISRSRGETAMLMSWQPPTKNSDESIKLENTRLKAQIERANLSATTQTKMKEDALAKLAKEREKVKQLEAQLEEEKKKKKPGPDADQAAAMAAATKDRDLYKKTAEEARAELAEMEAKLEEAEAKAAETENRAAELETAFNSLQQETEEQEAHYQKEIERLEKDTLYLTAELNKAKEESKAKGSAGDEQVSSLRKKLEQAESQVKDLEGQVEKLKALLEEERNNAKQASVSPAVAPKASPRTNSGKEKELPVAPARATPAKAPPTKAAPSKVPMVSPRAAPVEQPPAEEPPAEDVDLQKVLALLLEGKPCPHAVDVEQFKTEDNRLVLADCIKASLSQKLGKPKQVALAAREFDVLVNICKASASKLDPGSPADFTCAKKLLKAGSSCMRKDNKKYLREFVFDFNVWKGAAFWDDLFADRVARALKKIEENEPDEFEQTKCIVDTLMRLAQDMAHWKVQSSVIKEVVTGAADSEGLSDEDLEAILASVISEEDLGRGRGGSGAAGGGGGGDGGDGQGSDDEGRDDGNEGSDTVTRSGALKFKKASKWIKGNFTLKGKKLLYDYNEEGIGEFAEELVLTESHEAVPGSDQAPGALRNYSFRVFSSADNSVLHLLAAKQPEVNEWIGAINLITKGSAVIPKASAVAAPSPRQKSNSNPGVAPKKVPTAHIQADRSKSLNVHGNPPPASSGGKSAPPPNSASAADDPARKQSQPPLRIERSMTQQQRLMKEADVKMLVAKRWLRTHVELFDVSIVLTYMDPNSNAQVREDIPLTRTLIAPNSPLAPAALKDSSWRIKDGETEYHLMSNSKSDAQNWLTSIKSARDANK